MMQQLGETCGSVRLRDSGAAKSLESMPGNQIASRLPCGRSINSAMLNEIPDPRRAEGKLYKLRYILLFSVLAVITGGNSRSIETFIKVHRRRLNAAFGLHWKRAPLGAHRSGPSSAHGN